MVGESRRRDLAGLVDEVALGDQHQAVVAADVGEHLGDIGEQPDRLGQHVHAGFDDLADHRRRDPSVRHGHRGLHHRQRERLDPVAGDWDLVELGGAQRRRDVDPGVHVRLHELDEPGLDGVEGVLAVPERVVGVEPDHVEPSGHRDESADVQRWIALR